jgi:hypothetical protein
MNDGASASVPPTLEDVLITDQLPKRPVRERDVEAEGHALRLLRTELASRTTPQRLLHTLVDAALDLCMAGTAGLSVLATNDAGEAIFRWDALAGALSSFVGGTTPRHWSPCGTTLDRRAPQLFSYPGKFFTYFQEVRPLIVEGLVIPVYSGRDAVATIWIVSHDEQRQFDLYDVRTMSGLANFTGAALRLMPAGETAAD